MIVTSNISQIIQNMKRLEKEIPAMLARIVESDELFSLLKSSARSVLSARITKLAGPLAGPDFRIIEDKLIECVTECLTRRVTREGVQFTASIDESFSQTPSLADAADLNIGAHTQTGRIRKDYLTDVSSPDFASGSGSVLDSDGNLQAVRAAITEWVRTEKRKDERDAGKTDEQIADDIMFIMGVHQTRAPFADSDVRRDAAERLMPHIQDFIERASRGEISGLEHKIPQSIPEETIQEWLELVVATWRQVVPPFLVERTQIEMDKLASKFNT